MVTGLHPHGGAYGCDALRSQFNAYVGQRISNMGTLTTTRRRAISHRPLALALELDGSGPAAYRSSRAPTPPLLERRGASTPVHTTPRIRTQNALSSTRAFRHGSPEPTRWARHRTLRDRPWPPIRARTLDGVAIAGAADTYRARPRAHATQKSRPVEAPRRDAHNEMICGADGMPSYVNTNIASHRIARVQSFTAAANPFKGPF